MRGEVSMAMGSPGLSGQYKVDYEKNISINDLSSIMVILDAVPIINKFHAPIQECMSRNLISVCSDAYMKVLITDTITEMISAIFSMYDEDDRNWSSSMAYIDIFPDVLGISQAMPNSGIQLKHNYQDNLAQVSSELGNMSIILLNDLIWWLDNLIPIPRQRVHSIKVIKMGGSGLYCIVSHL